MAGFLLWLEPASPHRYIVRVGGAWGTGPANKWHWSVRISDPRMVRVAMRRSSQVLLPMTDSLMSIPQPFSYLTRAVSVGTTLSMSCSYLTRAVSVGIVFWSLFWNPRRSDMMSRVCRPYLSSTTAFSDRSIHFWNLRSITVGSKCCCTSCFLSNRVRSMKCVYFAHALAYRSVCAMNTPYDPSLGMLPDKPGLGFRVKVWGTGEH